MLTRRQTPLKKLPMMLLAVIISFQRALVRGAAPFLQRVPRGFASASVCDMHLTEHLRVVNWGLHCKVMRLLSLGTSRVSEMPGQNMMQRMVGRVAAGVAAAVRDRIFEHANELCTSGRRVDGALLLQQAIDLGHLPSRALKAWIECESQEYSPTDEDEDGDEVLFVSKKTQKLVEDGALWGCRDCQGVLAWLIHKETAVWTHSEEEIAEMNSKSLELALKSSEKGSRYGQFILGYFYSNQSEGPFKEKSMTRSFELYRLASSQGHDRATYEVAQFYGIYFYDEEIIGAFVGYDVLDAETRDAEALRLYLLAVTQGYQNPHVLSLIAGFYYEGFVASKNEAEAIRRLMCAKEASERKSGSSYGKLSSHDKDILKKMLDAHSQQK
jgi:hypothetical protein